MTEMSAETRSARASEIPTTVSRYDGIHEISV
jgi:hypothetical protein